MEKIFKKELRLRLKDTGKAKLAKNPKSKLQSNDKEAYTAVVRPHLDPAVCSFLTTEERILIGKLNVSLQGTSRCLESCSDREPLDQQRRAHRLRLVIDKLNAMCTTLRNVTSGRKTRIHAVLKESEQGSLDRDSKKGFASYLWENERKKKAELFSSEFIAALDKMFQGPINDNNLLTLVTKLWNETARESEKSKNLRIFLQPEEDTNAMIDA